MAQAGHPAANPYAPPASAPAREEQRSQVSKALLLLVTFFFGGIGAHKFYLGKWWQGALYLLFFWTGIPALVALVEFIVYCFTSEERLNQKYSSHGTAVLVVIVVAIFFGIAMLGILAAIAIPAYQDYTHRARTAEAIVSVSPWRTAVTEHYAQTRQLPNAVTDLAKDLVPAEPPGRYGMPSLGASGVITFTFAPGAGGRMAGKTIVFQPQAEQGRLLWDCTGGTLEAKYRPATCRRPR